MTAEPALWSVVSRARTVDPLRTPGRQYGEGPLHAALDGEPQTACGLPLEPPLRRWPRLFTALPAGAGEGCVACCVRIQAETVRD